MYGSGDGGCWLFTHRVKRGKWGRKDRLDFCLTLGWIYYTWGLGFGSTGLMGNMDQGVHGLDLVFGLG